MTAAPEKTSVSSWLAELRMECYKKQLEDFDTIKQLLDLKETELKLKKLGVVNSKDRAMMMGSLASFKKESSAHPSVAATQLQDKTVPRRGSFKKLKLKSLLSSGGSKKSKKKADNFSTSVPSSVRVQEIATPPNESPLSPRTGKPLSSAVDDYEEVLDLSPRSRAMTVESKSFQNWKVVENEYVPSPDTSPRFDDCRIRSSTISNFDRNSGTSDVSYSRPPSYTTDIQYRQGLVPKDDSPGALKHRHLSGVSMESGLSFGYDVEKDFNPSLPLENQPWFRGKIPRGEAEALLNDDGDFIVRENTAVLNTYTLSLRWRGAHDHTMINTTEVINTKGDISRAMGVKYHFESGAFDTIPELVFNHLKYQIPIDTAHHTLITNPICRPGSTNNSTPGSTHRVYNTSQSFCPPAERSAGPSPAQSFSTLPRNFGSWQKKQSNSSLPEDSPKTAYTMTRGNGASPRTYARGSSHMKPCNSSGDLLEESSSYEGSKSPRNVISPPPIAEFRTRAATTVNTGLRHANSACNAQNSSPVHKRQESFGDYEFMSSVSIQDDTESQHDILEEGYASPSCQSQSSPKSERVNYAEIVCLPKEQERRFTVATGSGTEAVKYAEVRFAHSKTGAHSSPQLRNTSPYQSRAESLANKALSESNYATPNPGVGYAKIKFADSSPHPFSQYASVSKTSSPSLSSREGSPLISRSQTDAHVYSRPDKLKKLKDRVSTASNDSALSTNSSHSSSPAPVPHTLLANVHSHAPSAKVHRDLPGYESLVKMHTILQSHSNKQLAYHLTRSDAVSFLLAPRPGEDDTVWRDRVNKVTSSSGAYRGLQTLADTDGEKLWKKLYYRHLNLSQTVTLCVITAGDALERAKLLHRFIEIASMLQSGKFGNLFSFISIIQGISVPQITDMVDVWDLLRSHFPFSASTHKDLMSIITNLNEGIPIFSTEQIIIPAIQHLKTVFHFSEPSLPGFTSSHEDRSLVGEYWSLACGLDGIRTIVSHTSQFSFNARRKLEGRRYDAKLMDFFMQDFTRAYLQTIGVHCDSPMERRRRFGVLMDALVVRVDASESV